MKAKNQQFDRIEMSRRLYTERRDLDTVEYRLQDSWPTLYIKPSKMTSTVFCSFSFF